MNNIIEVSGLTKKFNNGNGIFDVNFFVKEGEVFGYLGPNGAGKSTTIRHLLGFMKPEKGSININGFDVWKHPTKSNINVGYIPGEISMPEAMTGIEFIKFNFKLRKLKDWAYVEELIKFWKFNANIRIKRMSKGMKQKVALVCAFMHDPKILIFDEPTSGLDPIMQAQFIEVVQKAKTAGKTIILSSHIFQEVEKTCDRVAIIKNGVIVSNIDINEIRYNQSREYELQFIDEKEYQNFSLPFAEIIGKNDKWNSIKLKFDIKHVNEFTKAISKYNLRLIKEFPFTLEEYFMNFYRDSYKSDDLPDGGRK